MAVNIKDLDISKLSPQWQTAIAEWLGDTSLVIVDLNDWIKKSDEVALSLFEMARNNEIDRDELYFKLSEIERLTSEYILTKVVEKIGRK
jgi:hypothetical protein